MTLKFQTKNLLFARKILEMLLKGDKLINEKKEISWDVDQNNYKTSFYLKNKKTPKEELYAK